jgi:predicted transcriptional regulator
MSKAVMLSIRPKWCEKIASGEKTIEVRKTRPKLETPFKVYIYCTRGVALGAWGKHFKVIGKFTCDHIDEYDDDTIFSFRHEDYARWNDFGLDRACMHPEDFQNYADGKWLYGWHISDLKIYDVPKDLNEFWLPSELYCEKERCGGCPYDQVADVNGEYSFDCEWKRPLTRPPQSWCYVEVMQDG